MMWFSKKRQVAASGVADRASLPGTLATDFQGRSKTRYFELFVGPFRSEQKAWLVAGAFMALSLIEGLALVQLIPLHERVPYIAEFEDGKLEQDSRYKLLTLEAVKSKQTEYFIRLWLRWLFTIDSNLNSNLPKTAHFVRGSAVAELSEWIDRDRASERQVKSPGMTRSVGRISINWAAKAGSGFAHIELIERSNGVETSRTRKLLQFDSEFLAEQEGPENPIGLALTHFSMAEE